MSTREKNDLTGVREHQDEAPHSAREQPLALLSRAFVSEALSIYEQLVRWHLMALVYNGHGAASMREIARRLYDGPRRFGTPLPEYVDPELVQIVGGKLDTKRLSIANLHVENLFTRHLGFGRLLAGAGEGLGYDRLTDDGRKAAQVIGYLIDHWTNHVLTGRPTERVGTPRPNSSE